MGRSLRVAPNNLSKVKAALKRNGFPSQSVLAMEIGLSRATVSSFLNGRPIDYLNFVELSERLGYNWQEIADRLEENFKQDAIQVNEADSAFIAGSPILHPRKFFGRQRQLRRLFDLIKRHPLQNAAVIGKRRSGKTSLLRYLEKITITPQEELRFNQKSDWLPNPQMYRWIFVDFQDPRMESKEHLLSHILNSLHLPIPDSCTLENFMDVVGDTLSQPTVILMDEVAVGLERCPELDDSFWESLRSWTSHYAGGNLAFILSTPESPMDLARHNGRSSPFFNIFGYTANIGAFSEAEARELISSSPIPFPEPDVEWILNESRCWPFLVQILCRERLVSIEDGETGDEWKREGLEQIQNHRYCLEES